MENFETSSGNGFDGQDHAETAVYALTPPGARLGRVLAQKLGGTLFVPEKLGPEFKAQTFDSLIPFVGARFSLYKRHVFVTASGIAVRAVAPVLQSKDRDPAVVVVDQRGRFAVSLLSGHLGQANALAKEIAAITAGQAVITTATDTEDLPAIDTLALERGLAIVNLPAVKAVNIEILAGEKVQVHDPENWLGLRDSVREGADSFRLVDEGAWNPDKPGVWVSWKAREPEKDMLVLNPPCLAVGVGCRKGTSARDIESFIVSTLKEHGLAVKSLLALGTISDKDQEPGLLFAAANLQKALFFFEPEKLKKVTVPNPSERVEKHMGVPSVCEATAMLLAETEELLVPKVKSKDVTLAVALVP